MPETPRVRFDDLSPGGESFQLDGFVSELVATSPHQVIKALAEIEEASRDGLWAAGYLAYEAAPAFDPTMIVKPDLQHSARAPLLWFGLFRSRTRVPSVPRDFPSIGQSFECEWSESEHARAVGEA